MDIEIAAVMTIAGKLELLEKLLDRRMERAALDTVSPVLPLLEKVYTLGEYKRLAANLRVMEHRIRCELGDENCARMVDAARGRCGLQSDSRSVRAAFKKARAVLASLHVLRDDLVAYRALPLFRSECYRIERMHKKREEGFIPFAHGAVCDCCRVGETVPAL